MMMAPKIGTNFDLKTSISKAWICVITDTIPVLYKKFQLKEITITVLEMTLAVDSEHAQTFFIPRGRYVPE